jgi:hypothetical protein
LQVAPLAGPIAADQEQRQGGRNLPLHRVLSQAS